MTSINIPPWLQTIGSAIKNYSVALDRVGILQLGSIAIMLATFTYIGEWKRKRGQLTPEEDRRMVKTLSGLIAIPQCIAILLGSILTNTNLATMLALLSGFYLLYSLRSFLIFLQEREDQGSH